MEQNEGSSSPGWSASFFLQTTEDVARAVAAAVNSPRPSVVYSSIGDSGSPLQRLQHNFSKILKGLSSPPEVKSGPYNPEILTSQKRQWANFQLQSLDHKVWKEPSHMYESMVVVGLPASSDIQSLQNLCLARKSEGSGRFRSALGCPHQSRVEPILEPQVLFVYPPDKKLPLKYKDLLSFCFPTGVEVNAVERTPSMSELNEILLGQEHIKQSDLSFVFRLQVADDSTLYGCCVLVEEILQKPSGLISMTSDGQPFSNLSRYTLTTRRCYCILSRLPFFELHFGVLNSIFTEERLERLTKQIHNLDLESQIRNDTDENREEGGLSQENGVVYDSLSCVNVLDTEESGVTTHFEHESENRTTDLRMVPDSNTDAVALDPVPENPVFLRNGVDKMVQDSDASYHFTESISTDTVLPLSRFQQFDSSESSSSIQGSPSEGRHFGSDMDDAQEASSSGRDVYSENSDTVEWTKANNHGSLRIIAEYYQLCFPSRGSTIKFHPLDHLHPLEYHRPDETVLRIAGSAIDLRSCSTSLELAEVHSASMVEEEATALSVWAIACLCGSLRLEHVLTLLAGALLEKQIVIVCSNLGILSALVLSIIPLIRPYQWQSLLMPVLPNDMLDFLDAPVPYIVGVKNKTSEVQSKLTNVILADANKNQVKSPVLPSLPRHRELYSWLSPYHEKLVGESFLGKKRPVYDCTPVQVEAAKGFLEVLRSYLDSLCSNIRSHTITNVQSNDDKVSLLLKESFIDSFPSRDRSFMKLFLDTQLFSVHTDFVLSFFQKE